MRSELIHPTAVIASNAEIGPEVRVGPFSVVHDNVRIGSGSVIGAHVTLGEPLRSYYTDPAYANPPLVIGANSVVRTGSVLYAGSAIGDEFECGHHVVVREDSTIGKRCRLGTGSVLEGNLEVGDYVTMQTSSHVAPLTRIGNYVWLFPSVVFTNDPAPPGHDLVGTTIADYAVVATGVTLMPGIRIGEHSVTGAGSLVRSDVDDGMFADGRPAKVIAPVQYLRERGTGAALYPWPRRYSTGMPWAQDGWDEWIAQKDAGAT